MHGSINYQASRVWLKIDGIGKSKAEYRKEHPVKNIDNSRVTSPLVHSFEYKDEIFKTAKNLFNFAHQRGIKDMTKLDYLTVENWFENKMDDEVSRGTLQNYLSHIMKIQIGLNAIAEEDGNTYKGYTREELSYIHGVVNEMDRNKYINRAYKKPGYLISIMMDEREHLVATLQFRYGFRVSEAAYIKNSQLVGNTLTVSGKGGFIQSAELSDEHSQRLKRLMVDGIFKINKNRYRINLEKATVTFNVKYHGTHGLRYNFAQTKYNLELDIALEKGYPPLEARDIALGITSFALGHHRKEITYRYLG